jgi:transient receptor potential cation channel subfamily M protein 2
VQYLYDKEGWNLSMPQLVISVAGDSAQNFTIPQRMRTAFKRGLIKAATSTNSWIITGGTNAGVMRLVGEAVSEEFNSLVVIGIAAWGTIASRNKLVVCACLFMIRLTTRAHILIPERILL